MKKFFELFCRVLISCILWACAVWLFELEGFIVISSLVLCMLLVFSDQIVIAAGNGFQQFVESEDHRPGK